MHMFLGRFVFLLASRRRVSRMKSCGLVSISGMFWCVGMSHCVEVPTL
jgi:hypothetical protein